MIKQLCSKCCILLIAWVASIPIAFGQIAVGAKTGVNINQFSQPGTTMGVSIGAYGTYQVLPFLTARFEPQYSQEGGGRPDYTRYYDFNTSVPGSTIYSIQFSNPSVVFHTIQLPVFVELSLPEFAEESVKPKFMLGLSYGLVASAMEQHTKRYTFVDPSLPSIDSPMPMDVSYQRENVTSNYSRNQWNAWLGMGVDFKAGTRTFSFDVRYRRGLRNVNNLRFASPGLLTSTGYIGIPGTGGNLYPSSVSFNFSMSLFNF